ncbi:DNA polymerase I [uncultured Capnocytophaga sp.]|uniref:DNA polymerase I n=1 Tax=uncultured Capnocytophaga sp. TaxID=159273 RepID=UPI002607C585|nr:DNA polymerase I [uncultured Capnocytophaga sp.]
MKKLFLLDAYALIFRGYYAFIKNPRINSKGMNTSAIVGFMNSLLEVIRKEQPHLLAVCFDKGGSQQRTAIYPEYKANRDETPEAIRLAIPYIHQILEAMRIPIIEKEGYEADDIIGTLSKQAEKQGYTVYMVTPDKDYSQLVSPHIFMYKPARGGNEVEIWGVEEVKENFQVEYPEQVIDLLGMMGDAVDNIPGLPGVGEKTAQKLLKEFGSLENLLANTDKLKGKLRENIEANKEKGLLSKTLARILLDVPVTFDEKDFELSAPQMDKIKPIFEELEFRTMLATLQKAFGVAPATQPDLFSLAGLSSPVATQPMFAEAVPTQKLKTIKEVPHQYQLLTTQAEVEALLPELLLQKEVCFDTETTSLNELEAQIVGLALSWEVHKGYYILFPEDFDLAGQWLSVLKPFFESTTILKIGQNLKYDLKVLTNYGIEVCGQLFDTMIAHYLLNPDMRHNMDLLSEAYLGYTPIAIDTLIGKKGKGQLTMRAVPAELQKEYAVEDTDVTLQLKHAFLPLLEKDQMTKLFTEVEAPLVKVLAQMEYEGIRLDTHFLGELSKEINADLIALQTTIFDQAGESFNLSSPKQLGDILFEKLKLLSKPKKTKTGQYATSEEVLSQLASEYPIVANVLEFRALQKLQSTYIEALPREVNPRTGRVHTTFMQAVTATGRLSSNQPNLQNIPIRTPRGSQIRKAFVPRNEDYTLLSADYSQIELRIIAALSEEDHMIEAFLQGQDIHRSTAAKVFAVPIEEVTKEQRSHAKTVNFGIIYGVSAIGLSQQTSLTRSQSKELIDTYYQTYPKLKGYIEKQIAFAREHGYVETILGRRRYLPDVYSRNQVVRGAAERNAVNAPIQGSAADIIKIAMVRIAQCLEREHLSTRMLLQVHDELLFDVPKAELEVVTPLIREEMQQAYKLSVPLIVEIGTGNNWLEAH